VSPHFVETLMTAPDEHSLQRLVEERAALVRSASVGTQARRSVSSVSRDQWQSSLAGDRRQLNNAKEFAAAIGGRK